MTQSLAVGRPRPRHDDVAKYSSCECVSVFMCYYYCGCCRLLLEFNLRVFSNKLPKSKFSAARARWADARSHTPSHRGGSRSREMELAHTHMDPVVPEWRAKRGGSGWQVRCGTWNSCVSIPPHTHTSPTCICVTHLACCDGNTFFHCFPPGTVSPSPSLTSSNRYRWNDKSKAIALSHSLSLSRETWGDAFRNEGGPRGQSPAEGKRAQVGALKIDTKIIISAMCDEIAHR